MSKEFKREERYVVLKIKDLNNNLSPLEKNILFMIKDKVESVREKSGKAPLTCVVVESHWPEYEAFWSIIERHMTRGTDGVARDRVNEKLIAALSPSQINEMINLYEDELQEKTDILTTIRSLSEPSGPLSNANAGEVEGPSGSRDNWCASIDITGHGAAIQCWGLTKEEAISRRDAILKALGVTEV